MNPFTKIPILITVLIWYLVCPAEELIDLSGTWQVKLDPGDVGIQQSWFTREYKEEIQLPGSLTEYGYGSKPELNSSWTGIIDRITSEKITHPKLRPFLNEQNFKMPVWLQPETLYVGAAWYQKPVNIPDSWAGKRIILHLERCHWESTVWVDGKYIAKCNSLGSPHEFDLSRALGPGGHTIVIRIDNRMIVNVGPNSHSVSDHTQTNWNGIVGEIQLKAFEPVWIEDIQVYPNAASGTARVQVLVEGWEDNFASKRINWNLWCGKYLQSEGVLHPGNGGGSELLEFQIILGDDVKLWDEFNPNLYRLGLQIESFNDKRSVTFGFRDLETEGTRLKINGRNLFLRGTLECAIFPLTGYPPTDVGSWRRIIRVCKEYGLNHIRFHSWCPPDAAFVAADELGFYLQVECSSWANQGAKLGDGDSLDSWLYEEARRIVREYGNHPSFAFMAYGNEPGGRNRVAYLEEWCSYWKKKNPRCLHTSGAGWPRIDNSDYHNVSDPRIQQWGQGLKSRINAKSPETMTDYGEIIRKSEKPIIAHEIGQWCVYPNFNEMKKYTGVLKPRNFEIFRDLLVKNSMAGQAEDFLMASGKLQAICYKEEIEASLRTPEHAGFQLLDLHDFPGQGTALVGVVDPFWDPKPYISSDEFSRFCGPTVPLARIQSRVFQTDQVFHANIEIAHFGNRRIENVRPFWRIASESGSIVASGHLPQTDIPVDNCVPLGEVTISCADLQAPSKYRLVVGIDDAGVENDWEFWVYPESVSFGGDGITVASELTDPVIDQLKVGRKVLVLMNPERIKNDVRIGFSPVFWNTLWTNNQPPHTLGILCDPKHPVFRDFPTDYHSNWQWWELISGSSAMILDKTAPALQPLIQPIDTWFEARRLGLLFEAKVGTGKIIVASMDLTTDLDNRPVARQLRHSVLKYMNSDAFDPQVTLEPDALFTVMGPH